MAHRNEDLARRGFEAFTTAGMATLNELFADDIVWHSPRRNQLAGIFRGKGSSEALGLRKVRRVSRALLLRDRRARASRDRGVRGPRVARFLKTP